MKRSIMLSYHFQIAITAIRGMSYRGDIAIDELQVRPFRCGKCFLLLYGN